MTRCVGRIYRKTNAGTSNATMKTWWNILICMWIYFIYGAVNVNGDFLLTSSPLTATDGELFTLICSFHGHTATNIVWLQNNKSEVVTQFVSGCVYHTLSDVNYTFSRIIVSCNDTIHSIAFRSNSTTDQGAAWQCGKSMSNGHTHPRSNIYTIEVAPPVMSAQTLSTTTQYTETPSDPATATPKKAPADDSDSEHPYIVVGAVGGAALLTVVVVGIVCFRRKAAHQQNYVEGEGNATAGQVYQNTTSFNTMENDLYEGSRDVPPTNTAANQEDDFMLSDAYAGVDMPVTNTCTPREEVPSGDVNLENLYAKPDKSKHTEVQHDIYAVVQKPKKRKQDDPMVSEDFNTGDVYAKPNKGLKAQK